MDLHDRFPRIASATPRLSLARLPTPVREFDGSHRKLWIKSDDAIASPYGGNKVRKLEYLLGRLTRAGAHRPVHVVATFGTVASNHALATAIFARRAGLLPVCLLAHQTRTPLARRALIAHLSLGSELVPWAGDYRARLAMLRERLWHRSAAVIPMGGSSWTGSLGFVDAGLELAGQIESGSLPPPDRIYIATGTMGSTAGLAIGLALAGLSPEIHAVRVSPVSICSEPALHRLMRKICSMLNRLEPTIDETLGQRTRIVMRHEFFGPGYAKTTPATDAAITLAAEQAGLSLEPTYSGKAMAAVVADRADCLRRGWRQLFWNTCNSRPLPSDDARVNDADLPDAFRRYVDGTGD